MNMSREVIATRSIQPFPNEILAFPGTATIRGNALIRKLRCSKWLLLLAIFGGAVLAVVAIKLLALLAAAFDIPLLSLLRDLNNNIPPGGAAPPPPWWRGDGGGGNLGFLYISSNSGILHQDPSMDSRIVGTEPRGARALYDVIESVNGQDWYRIHSPGGPSGWIPGSDLSSTLPRPIPPAVKLRLSDTGLMDAHPSVAMTSGANG